MTKIAYQTRTGATQYQPVLLYHEYLHSDETGFCLHCGDYTEGGIEPDARRYACERAANNGKCMGSRSSS